MESSAKVWDRKQVWFLQVSWGCEPTRSLKKVSAWKPLEHFWVVGHLFSLAFDVIFCPFWWQQLNSVTVWSVGSGRSEACCCVKGYSRDIIQSLTKEIVFSLERETWYLGSSLHILRMGTNKWEIVNRAFLGPSECQGTSTICFGSWASSWSADYWAGEMSSQPSSEREGYKLFAIIFLISQSRIFLNFARNAGEFVSFDFCRQVMNFVLFSSLHSNLWRFIAWMLSEFCKSSGYHSSLTWWQHWLKPTPKSEILKCEKKMTQVVHNLILPGLGQVLVFFWGFLHG